MEVSQEQYNDYMRPWWAQQQRAKRNRDAILEKGYTKESYEDWKDGFADDTAPTPIAESIEEIVENKVLLELLNEALDTLLPDEKEIAVTVLSKEMSLSEFARIHDICRTTMSDKKRKVLKKLRGYFGEHGYSVGQD